MYFDGWSRDNSSSQFSVNFSKKKKKIFSRLQILQPPERQPVSRIYYSDRKIPPGDFAMTKLNPNLNINDPIPKSLFQLPSV